MTIHEEEILRQAIDTYGLETQMIIAIEEMAELTKEICKWFRGYSDEDGGYRGIAEEMADVEIMLDQMRLAFHNEDAVEDNRRRKLDRLEQRIRWAFSAVDVAMMMALLKIARIRAGTKAGTATEDSFVDLAGYAACGGEIATKQN